MNRYESNMNCARHHLGAAFLALMRMNEKKRYDFTAQSGRHIDQCEFRLGMIEDLFYRREKGGPK